MNHTFIVLAHGESPFLEECIISLKNQSLKSDIVVSTSTPNGFIKKITDKYQMPLYINKNRSGMAEDWNFGLNCAKTKYCTLAHQDDIYNQDYLFTCNKALSNDFSIMFTNYIDVNERLGIIGKFPKLIKRLQLLPFWVKNELYSTLLRKFILRFGNPIACPGILYNLDNLGEFWFDSRFTNNLDWFAWLQLSDRVGSFIYVPKILFKHRIHPFSTSSKSISDRVKLNEDLEIFKLMWPDWIANLMLRAYFFGYQKYQKK